MSARRALGIQEILWMVLNHFHPERWLDTDGLRSGKVSLPELRRTLARLARVSRAFSGPVICALWAVIDDFEPLLRLLSCCQVVQIESDCSEIDDEESKQVPEDVDERNTLQVLSGEVSPADWERFQYYAGLVHICLHDYDATIDPSVYLQLSLYNGGKPLLPSLRYLQWQQQSCNTYDLLHIIGPSLRRVRLRIGDLEIWARSQTRTRSAIRAWIHLRHVYVGSLVEVAVLQMLADHLENLNSLRMDLSDIRGRGETCHGFRSLESLRIKGIPPALEWFFEGTQLPRLLDRVYQRWLTRDTSAHLSDADIVEITRHWSKLRSLKLDHVFTTVEPSVRTLDIIARGLPHLEELVHPRQALRSAAPQPVAHLLLPRNNLRQRAFHEVQVFPNVVPSLPTLFHRRPCEDWCLIVDSFRPVH
ncbi:uncharacterized protein C8Q71DRAFT_910621 [Rhodofomes roseus]|uniref:Uncharacterized protein n=1 Tax=Rhodofomes roseus TaxID=34475 RepID=A0ABQ8K4I9_9APHY|nr:uncharacterized protein C8Q71DRAFT_910621 [Rhodofomes roseus]KAH9831616.1 hypothetical protein C8Q71DRAFT_910621 [Rhodofomes roseus]